ncbi:MAG: hypothetical protein ACLQBX_13790 [Candidatus Limnocylindrales bacterium]
MPTIPEVLALTDHGLSDLLPVAWRSSPQNPRPENVTAEESTNGATSVLSSVGSWVRPSAPTTAEERLTFTDLTLGPWTTPGE